ncbi:MAG: AAA family ATPase [Candidatus Izemoplasma sp.]|nr:AAA family ATPase [Candidatus Izemoplasma sp.]
MVEHIYIKNYKAFKKENIPLEKHTLLVGTNNSGKTTVLEALDLFFNHRMRHDFIIDRTSPVIIELQVAGKRYRKAYSPPYFDLDYKQCIGDLYDINDYAFLYIPKHIHIARLLNDILTVNMTSQLNKDIQRKIFKVADYIDGVPGNTDYPFFTYHTIYQMDIKRPPEFDAVQIAKCIANVTHDKTIIGIDNYEDTFSVNQLDTLKNYMFQTIFATDSETVIQASDAYIAQLLTGDKEKDFKAMQKRVSHSEKAYILVEGKYDVSWFEKALELLDLDDAYTVLPCGGFGNIQYVKEQLDKEGFQSIVVTDGDTLTASSLKRDVIEMYVDLDFLKTHFDVYFEALPDTKQQFFKHIDEKEDVIKHVLSKWAKHQLSKDNPFVKELKHLLSERSDL